MGLKIIDISGYIPERKVNNKYFEDYLDTSDDWIRKRTGIKERRFSHIGVSEMLKLAADKLKTDFTKEKDKLKLVLTATISADYIMPSISSIIHKHLNLNENVFCADVNMACSGYVGILIMAEAMLEVGDYAICIGAERLSEITDFNDRSTAILFGDGAFITLVEKIDEEFIKISGTIMSHDLGLERNNKVKMNGKEIYRFATSKMPVIVKEIIRKSNMDIDEIGHIVLHQANLKIIESVYKKTDYKNKYYYNVDRFGNTSSASIGLCLNEMREKLMLKKGENVVLLAFGGGLTYAGVIVRWG
ncbi:MAG: ketoacyl-ACP synthase III [Peptoniphilaceae bacterium]